MPRICVARPSIEEVMQYSQGQIPYHFFECLELLAEGLTYAQIADRLVIPVGTVKSRINRGREHLMKLEKQKSALNALAEIDGAVL